MSIERDVYRKELLKLGHGLPVYEPDPAGEFDRVRVGDVGYVDRFGRFHSVFNAFLPKEHPVNQQRGTPEGYVPLESRSSTTFFRADLPAGAMLSTYVRVLGCNLDISGSSVPANATIKLSVSNNRGAALVIRHPASREESSCENHLESYMLQHYPSWLTFFRDVLGCPISLHDIILTTGCDLTADWATATFVEKTAQCEIEFKAGDPALLASGSAAFWGTWQSSISVPHRCGPGPVRRPTALTTRHNDGRVPSQDRNVVEGRSYDQCIFLRGFRVRERKLRAPRIMRAAAEPNDLDMNRDGDLQPAITSLEHDSDSDEYGSEADIRALDDCSFAKREVSIYDTLLDLILEVTDADIALIHDRDVCRIIEYAGEDLRELSDVKFMQKYGISIRTYFHAESQMKVGHVVAKDINAVAHGVKGRLAPANVSKTEVETWADDSDSWTHVNSETQADWKETDDENQHAIVDRKLAEAAAEAQRQRDLFAKVDRRSYTRVRTEPGLLSAIFYPESKLFPPDQSYRHSQSMQDILVHTSRPSYKAALLQPSKGTAAIPVSATVTAQNVGSSNQTYSHQRSLLCAKGRPQDSEKSESDEGDEEDEPHISENAAEKRLALLQHQNMKGARMQKLSKPMRQAHVIQQAQQMNVLPVSGPSLAVRCGMPISKPSPLARIVTEPVPLGYPYNLNLPPPMLLSTPRTTRRNMLSVELSESLRRNLLWERQVSRQRSMDPDRRIVGSTAPPIAGPSDMRPLNSSTDAALNADGKVDSSSIQEGVLASAGTTNDAPSATGEENIVGKHQEDIITRNDYWADSFRTTGW